MEEILEGFGKFMILSFSPYLRAYTKIILPINEG